MCTCSTITFDLPRPFRVHFRGLPRKIGFQILKNVNTLCSSSINDVAITGSHRAPGPRAGPGPGPGPWRQGPGAGFRGKVL